MLAMLGQTARDYEQYAQRELDRASAAIGRIAEVNHLNKAAHYATLRERVARAAQWDPVPPRS